MYRYIVLPLVMASDKGKTEGKFHLHGLLRKAVRQRPAHMGELQNENRQHDRKQGKVNRREEL